MIRSINPTEHQIQYAIVEWANNTKLPYGNKKIGDYLFAIPNGGNRSITEAIRLKKEGVKKGVSDLFLAFSLRHSGDMISFYRKCGMWLEIKSKKGKLSKSQSDWNSLMSEIGYDSRVVYSVDEGIYVIKDYLGIK